jgi:cell division protease FtsH
MEGLLAQEYERASALLNRHAGVFIRVVEALMRDGSVAPAEFARLLDLPVPGPDIGVLEPYALQLEAFRAGIAALDAASAPIADQADSTIGSSAMRP